MTDVLTVIVPLLDEVPAPSDVNPGAVLAVVLGLIAGASVLLWFSMRRHLRRVNFDVPEDRPEDAPTEARSEDRPPEA